MITVNDGAPILREELNLGSSVIAGPRLDTMLVSGPSPHFIKHNSDTGHGLGNLGICARGEERVRLFF